MDTSSAGPLGRPGGSRSPTAADVELFWAVARLPPELGVIAATAEHADIGSVLEAASRHRLGPLVLRALTQAGIEVNRTSIPAAARATAWQARGLLAVPEAAAAALGPLNDAGLTPLLLKGIALVERYPAAELRPMDDIDVLLPKPLARRAVTALESAGWRSANHFGRDPGYDLAFTHPSSPGVALEVHFELAPWHERSAPLRAANVWSERVPTTVFGFQAFTLPPELEES